MQMYGGYSDSDRKNGQNVLRIDPDPSVPWSGTGRKKKKKSHGSMASKGVIARIIM